MNKHILAALLTSAVALASTPTQACGEGQFNMGQGLRYQGYLAPRPATVLVFDDAAADRDALYAGLKKAGHKITLVGTPDALSQALRARRFDVVIADFVDVSMVDSSTADAKPHLLPVVERSRRNAPELRSRFNLFLLEGASLGQYLKSIDQLVKGAMK